MYTEITDTQAIGKTIENFIASSCGEQFMIAFTDKTFTILCVERGYDDDVSIATDSIIWSKFRRATLIKYKILSQEESDLIDEDAIAQGRRRRENIERREYARLKAKFE